jgi:hypothetical protein
VESIGFVILVNNPKKWPLNNCERFCRARIRLYFIPCDSTVIRKRFKEESFKVFP